MNELGYWRDSSRDISVPVKPTLPALVIDDEPQISSFVAQILSSNGWNVSEANSSEQAFQMLNGQKWVLVFCDVMLGETDGYAVLRRFSEE